MIMPDERRVSICEDGGPILPKDEATVIFVQEIMVAR